MDEMAGRHRVYFTVRVCERTPFGVGLLHRFRARGCGSERRRTHALVQAEISDGERDLLSEQAHQAK